MSPAFKRCRSPPAMSSTLPRSQVRYSRVPAVCGTPIMVPPGASSVRDISRPDSASGTSARSFPPWRLRSCTFAAGMNRNSDRGAPMSSSIETFSAFAALLKTASVGFAVPVSRLAQVGRGIPESSAMCCCERLRDSRRRRRFSARFLLMSAMLAKYQSATLIAIRLLR